MKNKNLILRIFLMLGVVGVASLFAFGDAAATDPIGKFSHKFGTIWTDHLSSLFVFGAAAMGLYEFYKTKQWTLLTASVVVVIILISLPGLSDTAVTEWKVTA